MLKVIDLFSGAGGLSLASKLLGLNVVGALEVDHYSCETYRNNLIGTEDTPILIESDITELSPQEFMKRIGIKRDDCDIILGGPPCQGFSSLSYRNSHPDPRNKLLWHYFEYIEAIAPKAFLVENVPGMLWDKNREFVDRFYELADIGGYYLYKPEILDAKDYGVPQTRKRVFIYGIKKDLKDLIRSKWPPEITHGLPRPLEVEGRFLEPYVEAKSVFEVPLAKNDPNNIHMKHSKRLIEVFKSTPINGGSRADSCRVLPCHKFHNGHKDVYGRINPNKPGPTMTTSCTNPSKGRFVHPTENHGITVRHAAKFQTFPDYFVFSGGIIAASIQIGNAVPITLGKAVINQIVDDLIQIKEATKRLTHISHIDNAEQLSAVS